MFSCRTENSQALTDFLKYLPKNMAFLEIVEKKKKIVKSVPGFFKTKKRRKTKLFCPLSRWGGGVKGKRVKGK